MTALRSFALDSAPVVDIRLSLPPVKARLHLAPATAAAPAEEPNTLKNMALFLSAPFVGLVSVILLPFVGIGMLAWAVAKAVMTPTRMNAARRLGKSAAMMVAAPFAGLAFVALLPFIGAALLLMAVAKAVMTPARMDAARRLGKSAATMVAAPFAGLAFVALLPFIGAAILVKVGRET
jgi:hypothetical protein